MWSNKNLPACRFDPLWNSLVVCGLQPEADSSHKPFIGFVGMIGTHYEDVNVATGEQLVQKQTDPAQHMSCSAGAACCCCGRHDHAALPYDKHKQKQTEGSCPAHEL